MHLMQGRTVMEVAIMFSTHSKHMTESVSPTGEEDQDAPSISVTSMLGKAWSKEEFAML